MTDPDLFPTRTRLALLAAVRDLKVADDTDGNTWSGDTWLDLGDGTRRKVTAEMHAMWTAGWVYQIPDGLGWRLTQRGLDILEGRR